MRLVFVFNISGIMWVNAIILTTFGFLTALVPANGWPVLAFSPEGTAWQAIFGTWFITAGVLLAARMAIVGIPRFLGVLLMSPAHISLLWMTGSAWYAATSIPDAVVWGTPITALTLGQLGMIWAYYLTGRPIGAQWVQ